MVDSWETLPDLCLYAILILFLAKESFPERLPFSSESPGIIYPTISYGFKCSVVMFVGSF